jgi:prepilin-type N-terminal cleavage/methylation domain-containing protein
MGQAIGVLGRRLRTERGFTLIELIIAMGLMLLVLTVIGGIMISGFTTQQGVGETTTATSQAQLTARQLEANVRQASMVEVFEGDATDSQLMVARTETGSGEHDWECQAWFYDDTAGAIFHLTYQGDNTWPWGSSITNWIDLGSGITEAVDVGSILGDTLDWLFGGADDGVAEWSMLAAGIRNETGSNDATQPVFTSAGDQSATIRFEVDAGDSTPMLITTTATGRQPAGDEEPTCF